VGKGFLARAHGAVAFGRQELPDSIPGKGPLGGILTGLETTDQAVNLFIAVDLPLLSPEFLKLFHSRFHTTEKPLMVCRIAGDYPLCLGVQKKLVTDIARRVASDNLSIRALIEESDPEILTDDELQSLGFDCGMFANMNTPQDWRQHQ
jgi:molybdenum cofactor guanylyltransferase